MAPNAKLFGCGGLHRRSSFVACRCNRFSAATACEIKHGSASLLNTSQSLAGGVALSRDTASATPLANWAGNLRYSTGNVLYPTSVEQVQHIVRKYDKLRALGTGHSFNTIADSEHNLLSLRALNRVVSLDRSANTVTVEVGMKYGELAPY